VGKFIHLLEMTELAGEETCVTVCIAFRWIERGKLVQEHSERERQR
jgi:hypothetical protein